MVHTMRLADGLYIDINRMWSGQGLMYQEAAGFEASELTAPMERLREAVKEAKRLDAEDANSWWQELWERVTHLGGYKEDKERFDREVKQVIEYCDERLELVGERITLVQEEAGPIPGQLETQGEAWKAASQRAEGIQSRIAAIQAIPGWQGETSSKYQVTNAVQGGATVEFAGMASSLGKAINQVALFNRAIFQLMGEDIDATADRIAGEEGGADGYHYRRTANARAYLNALLEGLNSCLSGEATRDATQSLESKVQECLQAPNLLQPGVWPRGSGGRAGVPPAETDTIPDAEESDATVDHSGAAPGQPGQSGVKR